MAAKQYRSLVTEALHVRNGLHPDDDGHRLATTLLYFMLSEVEKRALAMVKERGSVGSLSTTIASITVKRLIALGFIFEKKVPAGAQRAFELTELGADVLLKSKVNPTRHIDWFIEDGGYEKV